MRILLAVLLLLLVAVVPVSAEYVVTGDYAWVKGGYLPFIANNDVVHFNCTPDQAISSVEYDLPLNTTVNFTVYYGNGNTMSGWMVYRSEDPGIFYGHSISEVSLDGNTRSEIFGDLTALGYSVIDHVQFSSYGVNTSNNETGFTLYAQGYALWSEEIVFAPVPNIAQNLISGISITSTRPIKITILTADYNFLAENIRQGALGTISALVGGVTDDILAWINLAYEVGVTLWYVVTETFYWAKFFLWDNLLLTVALWIAITGAMAFGKTKDIFKAMKTFFHYQKVLFEFILDMWKRLIDLIATFRGIFRI
jgi:hypothetical protein